MMKYGNRHRQPKGADGKSVGIPSNIAIEAIGHL
jgi:hypothetical protein